VLAGVFRGTSQKKIPATSGEKKEAIALCSCSKKGAAPEVVEHTPCSIPGEVRARKKMGAGGLGRKQGEGSCLVKGGSGKKGVQYPEEPRPNPYQRSGTTRRKRYTWNMVEGPKERSTPKKKRSRSMVFCVWRGLAGEKKGGAPRK